MNLYTGLEFHFITSHNPKTAEQIVPHNKSHTLTRALPGDPSVTSVLSPSFCNTLSTIPLQHDVIYGQPFTTDSRRTIPSTY